MSELCRALIALALAAVMVAPASAAPEFKADYDPDNVFWFNHNIEPARIRVRTPAQP
jgi:Berberine and berberine like